MQGKYEKRNSGDVKKISLLWHFLELCFKESDSNIDRKKNWHSTVEYSEWSWQKWEPDQEPECLQWQILTKTAGITCNRWRRGWLSLCLPFCAMLGFLHKDLFSWAYGLTMVLKVRLCLAHSLVTGERMMLHPSAAPWPALVSALSFPCYCEEPPASAFTLQTIPRESRGASEVDGGSAGSWLLCMSCMHFSSVLRKSLVIKLTLQWEK